MTEDQVPEPFGLPMLWGDLMAALRLRRDDSGRLALTTGHGVVAESGGQGRERPAPLVRIGAHDHALLDPLTVFGRLR